MIAAGEQPWVWAWSRAGFGAALAVPAAVVALSDPTQGLALALGVFPAAALGPSGPRRELRRIALVGALAGGSILVGSLLTQWPVLAVIGLFVACVLAAVSSTRHRFGGLVLTFCIPLLGAGLGVESPRAGAAAFVLITVGSVYGWIVALLWPRADATTKSTRGSAPTTDSMLIYGAWLGLAGASAAALGYLLDLAHVGWTCAAALLVSRPDWNLMKDRGAARIAFVAAGAMAAALMSSADPPNVAYAGAAVLSLAVVAGASGSRWYFTPAFTTFLVLALLIRADTDEGSRPVLERMGDNLLGALLAVIFVVVVPWTVRHAISRPH